MPCARGNSCDQLMVVVCLRRHDSFAFVTAEEKRVRGWAWEWEHVLEMI